ncbi:OmcA/MtrC family decaheme c-type cytochrome [Chrysiogenes arsenatis]|uniref:OmcA/MtrC family decaheme c-type cytochrome n=1 Tax=Chrysiogenes arsenatis TaxID=309797 RepID=UPI0004885092|nr:OmcA/MtrC family decaheme c-type cytochrome [Chrysiogenes arsenatis]
MRKAHDFWRKNLAKSLAIASVIGITSGSALAQSITIAEGWNLKGSALDGVNVSTTFNNSNIATVWGWQTANQKWSAYSPSTTMSSKLSAAGIDSLATINAGQGFWINASTNIGAVTLSGTAPSSANLQLAKGWNLISPIGKSFVAASEFTHPTTYASVWKWSNNDWETYSPNSSTAQRLRDAGFRKLATIAEGEGFWVNTLHAAGVTPPMPATHKEMSLAPILPSRIDTINVITDGTKKHVELTLSIDDYPRDSVRAEFTMAMWDNDKKTWVSMLQQSVGTPPAQTRVIRGGNLRLEGATAIKRNNGVFSAILVGAGSNYGGANPIDFSNGPVWNTAASANIDSYASTDSADYRSYVQGIMNNINAYSWNNNTVYRVAVTSRTNADQPERFNALAYFKGDGTVVNDPAAAGVRVIDMASCTKCHGERMNLRAHGAQRHDPNVCTNCHNNFTFDRSASSKTAGGWASLSMTTIAHKIHAGIPGYTVDGKPFEQVRFPDHTFRRNQQSVGDGYKQQTKNCVACHIGDVPAVNTSWNTVSVNACATCHTPENLKSRADAKFSFHDNAFNSTLANSCTGCHDGATAKTAAGYHGVDSAVTLTKLRNRYVFDVIRVKNPVAGETAEVEWGIKDTQTGNYLNLMTAQYDTTDAVRVGIGWGNGNDWVNDGFNKRTNGADGDTFYVSAFGNSTLNADSTKAITSIANIPTTATAGRNGYVAVYMGSEDTAKRLTVGTTSGVQLNTITRTFTLAKSDITTLGERRKVVDIAKCNDCHGSTGRHGTFANNDINGCVSCHNAGSLSRSGSIIQGTVDMMYLMHAIHSIGEKRGEFIRRYAASNYAGHTQPNSILDCTACHVNDSHKFPIDFAKRAGVYADSPDSGVNAPMASVCYSCHQNTADTTANTGLKTHMSRLGLNTNMFGTGTHKGYFDNPEGETSCISCHFKN